MSFLVDTESETQREVTLMSLDSETPKRERIIRVTHSPMKSEGNLTARLGTVAHRCSPKPLMEMFFRKCFLR